MREKFEKNADLQGGYNEIRRCSFESINQSMSCRAGEKRRIGYAKNSQSRVHANYSGEKGEKLELQLFIWNILFLHLGAFDIHRREGPVVFGDLEVDSMHRIRRTEMQNGYKVLQKLGKCMERIES